MPGAGISVGHGPTVAAVTARRAVDLRPAAEPHRPRLSYGVRPGSSDLLSFATGIAAGLVITIPQFRPMGVPLAYASLLVVAAWAAIRGLRVPISAPPLIALWAVPVAYAVAHDVVLAAGETLQLFVRNSVALGAAWLLAATMREGRRGLAALAGLGLVMSVDAAFGIGQAQGAEWATFGSLLFASEEVVGGYLSGDLAMRSWGIHSYVHMYAYTISLWVFVTFAWLACVPSGRSRWKPFVLAAFLTGVTALLLSGQRSAVGSVVGSMIVVLLVTARRNPRLVLALVGFLVVAGSVGLAMLADDALFALERLVTGVDVASDSERSASWVEGWRVLQEDPYLGTAYGSYAGRIGIHNAFLGGWARYGLPWLVLVFAAMVVSCWYFLTARRASRAVRAAALLYVGVMLANAMFHTSGPTLNDMPFLVLLGPILAMVATATDASAAQPASTDFGPAVPTRNLAVG